MTAHSEIERLLRRLGAVSTGEEQEEVLAAGPEGGGAVAAVAPAGEISDGAVPHGATCAYLLRLSRIAGGAHPPGGDADVAGLVEDILARHLDGNDFWLQHGSTTYVVAFPSLGPTAGQLKAQLLADEIVRVARGEPTAEAVAVTPGDAEGLRFYRSPGALALLDRLNAEAAWAEGATARPRPAALAQLRIIFRPMLTVRRKVVSTFFTIPVRQETDGRFKSGYDVLQDPGDPDQLARLDLHVLERVGAELETLVAADKKSLLALPVHFETLNDRDRFASYLDACTVLFHGHNNRAIFEINGLPETVSHTWLKSVAAALRGHGPLVIVRVPVERTDFSVFRSAGVHAVGIDVYAPNKDEKALMAEMDAFVENAKNETLRTYILGVHSLSLFTAAVTSGFEYIAGHSMSSALDGPTDIYSFRLDSPYEVLMNRNTGKPAP